MYYANTRFRVFLNATLPLKAKHIVLLQIVLCFKRFSAFEIKLSENAIFSLHFTRCWIGWIIVIYIVTCTYG